VRHSDFLLRHGPKLIVALMLTFASGLVDIIGYLGVFHLFTAHLTGTTVHLGQKLVSHGWDEALGAAVIVAAFMGGSLLGRAAIEIGSRRRIQGIASVTLAIESIVLLCVALTSSAFLLGPYGGIALLAAAMGIQTATLTGVGPLTVHTTFVTGMMNKIAQLVSHILFRSYDLRNSQSPSAVSRQDQRRDIEMTVFLAAIWCCYVGGAAFGTWSFNIWRLDALFVAIALLILSLVVDRFWPLAIREEQEQSER
jgi:uncharacterized membrane protein YoaK (UPF0700 family)